ncbi:MAG: Ig-like domain-containing protein [Pseudomonadota bacterium]
MRIRAVIAAFAVSMVSACGGGGGSSSPPVNRAPSVAAQNIVAQPGETFTGSFSGSDADGDTLSFSVAAAAGNGTVTITGNQFEYQPNAGFSGSDSFDVVANDGTTNSAPATIGIAVNARPVLSAPAFATADLVPLSGSVTASDAENDALTLTVTQAPSNGDLMAFDAATGDFIYVPDPQTPAPDTFTVVANDPIQASDPLTVSIDVSVWAGRLQFGTSGDDDISTGGLYVDDAGNILVGGATTGSLDGNPVLGTRDSWLAKYDAAGNQQWLQQFGAAPDDFSRVVLPDPLSGGTTVISRSADNPGDDSIYRFDTNGNEIVAHQIDYQGRSLLVGAYWGNVDAAGDVYVLSWPTGASSLVSKVDATTGATEWELELFGSLDASATPTVADWRIVRARSVSFDSAGNGILIGTVFNDANNLSGFLARITPDGSLTDIGPIPSWEAGCQADRLPIPYRAEFAADGSFWVTGAQVDLNQTYVQISKYSADLTTQEWSYCYSDEVDPVISFHKPVFTADGDGLFVIRRTFQNAPPLNEDLDQTVVIRLSPDGEVRWTQLIAGIDSAGFGANVTGSAPAEGINGELYVAGVTRAELLPGAALGGTDAFLLRFGADGQYRNFEVPFLSVPTSELTVPIGAAALTQQTERQLPVTATDGTAITTNDFDAQFQSIDGGPWLTASVGGSGAQPTLRIAIDGTVLATLGNGIFTGTVILRSNLDGVESGVLKVRVFIDDTQP